MEHLKQPALPKKVLVVISDGGDNASHHTMKNVLQDTERSNEVIYSIGLFDEYDEDKNPAFLRKIAQATGGEAFLPQQTRDAFKVCERIAHDIRNQYTIGDEPANPALDGTYRKILVEASDPRHKRLTVRTRDRYLAAPGR